MGRLVKPITKGASAFSGEDESPAERVVKYIPAEVVAGYLTIQNLVLADADYCSAIATVPVDGWWYALYVFFLAVTPAYLFAQRTKGEPFVLHLIVGTVAFVIWTYALTSCPKFGVFYPIYDETAAAVLLVLFTLVSGLLVPRKQ